MMRLNSRAKNLLQTEIAKQAQPLNLEVQSAIVLKRLHKISQEPGSPLSQSEMASLVLDLFPQFDPQVLARAARVNRPQRFKLALSLCGLAGGGAIALSGLVWLVNLPYPMIRRPVARVAPLLLLPSYLEMDRNYRESIAHVEQADQLVNQATSEADIRLGAEKVKMAQSNLDKLPVWFLGYEPMRVCSFMSCSWNFTFDEFNRARAQIGRMEAIVFQEVNALQQLKNSETTLSAAKQTYQSATNLPQKQAAIATWQTAVNELGQIPPRTLAGKQAQIKQQNYSQELGQIAGQTMGKSQTQVLIAAAQEFASRAKKQAAQTPRSVAQWQQIQILWQEAIARLKTIDPQDPDYLSAQSFLADYTQRLGDSQTKLEQEQKAVQIYEQAQQKIQTLLSRPSAPNQPSQLAGELTGIISQLQTIPAQTTPYGDAQIKIQQAQEALKKISSP